MGFPRFAHWAALTLLLLVSARTQATADIEVTIQASPVPVAIDSLITYDVLIRNHGPDVAQLIEVGYSEMVGDLSVSNTPPVGWQSGCVCVHVFCSCSVWRQSVPVGATAVWRIVRRARPSPVDPSVVAFQLFLRSAPLDPTPTPEVRISTPIAGDSGSADLRLELLSSTNPVVPGGVATYRMRLINSGPSPAQQVLVRAGIASPNFPNLPPAAVSSMQGPADWQCGGLPLPPASVHCTRAEFATGTAEFTVTVEASSLAGSSFEFLADASSTTPDPVPTNNRIGVITQIGGAGSGVAVPALSPPLLALLALLLGVVGVRASTRRT